MENRISDIFTLRNKYERRNKLVKIIAWSVTASLLVIATILFIVLGIFRDGGGVATVLIYIVIAIVGICIWYFGSKRIYQLDDKINAEVAKFYQTFGVKTFSIDDGMNVLDVVPTRMISVSNNHVESNNLLEGTYKDVEYRLANMKFDYTMVTGSDRYSFNGLWMKFTFPKKFDYILKLIKHEVIDDQLVSFMFNNEVLDEKLKLYTDDIKTTQAFITNHLSYLLSLVEENDDFVTLVVIENELHLAFNQRKFGLDGEFLLEEKDVVKMKETISDVHKTIDEALARF